MAKVRKFKDRRKPKEVAVCDEDHDPSTSAQQTGSPEGSANRLSTAEEDDQDDDSAIEEPVHENVSDPALSQPLLSQPCLYPINVPGVEELMALVQEEAEPQGSHMSALTASWQRPYRTHQPSFKPYIHPVAGLPVTGLPFFGRTPEHLLCGSTPPPPTAVELAGYAGLEELPILGRMMKHPELNEMYTFYFRFNDTNCPAAVLLVDPLPSNSRYAKYERNCHNSGHEAWLYVRKRGDVKWTRDWMAERGGMRQAVHLSRRDEGWMWEQQLGDLLDCRKSLNLWIQVKA